MCVGSAFAGNTQKSKKEALKAFVEKNKYKASDAVAKQLTAKLNKDTKRQALFVESATDPSASFTAPGWGFLLSPDGKQWSYTQSYETNSDGSYKSSTITVYDENHTQVGGFTVDVSDVQNVNYIAVSGDVTNKLFDRSDSSNELMVWYHTALNGVTSYTTRVYRLDGTLLYTYSGSSILVDASQNEWTTYQRVFLVNDVTEDVEEDGETVTKSYSQVDVLRPASWGEDGPQVEHTFKIDNDYLNYMNGSYINFFVIDGNPYYVLSQYEKPYTSGYNTQTWELEFTENNSFVVTVYDKSYNQVAQMKAPIEIPEDAYCRMAGFGMLNGNDLSHNYYTSTGDFDFVVTWDDYITSTDEDRYKFDIYDANSSLLNTICDNVYNTYYSLKDIKGEEEQIMFMQVIDDVETIQLVNVPSCEKVLSIPAEIEGETISTDLNRYSDGKGGYNYVIKMGYATSDENGNVIARLGWYNTALELDHYTSFNLGTGGENFRPGLLDEMLNPYLFNTDDELEYLYFAKIRNTSTGTIDDVLVVANENGDVIRSFTADDTKGALYTAAIFDENVDVAQLGVCYMDDDYNYTYEFYDLPFSKFEQGGDGTAENPYIISTVGDLLQINSNVSAYYKLANDLDMSSYNSYWTPLNTFTGQLDGDNHYISGLSVSTDGYDAGLFSTLGENSVVKNLILINPEIKVNADNTYAGVLAGEAGASTIENVHVYGGNVYDEDGSASVMAGGLVGQATYYGSFKASSFEGNISLTGSSNVGGIAGDVRTSTTIDGCYASGTYEAYRYLGGIAGYTGSGSTITNSHANVELTASNTVGGIVGYDYGRALIDKCYVEGTIQGTTSRSSGISVGGIVGYLNRDWEQLTGTDFASVVSNCVAMANITVPEVDETVHRIIGSSIINEEWYEGETPVAEKAISSNYALNTVLVNDNAVTSDDATSTEGASIEASNLTNTFFSETLGYAYGEDISAPWKGETAQPILFFEDIATAILLSEDAITLDVDGEFKLDVYVYGVDASSLSIKLSDSSVADVETVAEEGSYACLSITGKKEGNTVLTISAGDLSVDCNITVIGATAINKPSTSATSLVIKAYKGNVTAAGAESISVYSIDGKRVASTNGDSVSTSAIGSGVYVVVATDSEGHSVKGKFVVR